MRNDKKHGFDLLLLLKLSPPTKIPFLNSMTSVFLQGGRDDKMEVK
jgi:hypothetical protein